MQFRLTLDKKWILLIVISLCCPFFGCSLNRFVARTTADVVKDGIVAIYRENDLQIAEDALGANLKLLEILLENDPQNDELKILLAQGYYAYALSFAEDEDPSRAKKLFTRGFEYAWQVLLKHSTLEDAMGKRMEAFEEAVGNVKPKWLEPLFWSAANKGELILLSLDSPQAIFELPKVEVMMKRCLQLDESYFFAAAHLFFGALYAAKPVMLGGKPTLAKKHFDRADELNKGECLLIPLYRARFLAVHTQNESLFTEQLNRVLQSKKVETQNLILINEVARQKAKLLLHRKDELF